MCTHVCALRAAARESAAASRLAHWAKAVTYVATGVECLVSTVTTPDLSDPKRAPRFRSLGADPPVPGWVGPAGKAAMGSYIGSAASGPETQHGNTRLHEEEERTRWTQVRLCRRPDLARSVAGWVVPHHLSPDRDNRTWGTRVGSLGSYGAQHGNCAVGRVRSPRCGRSGLGAYRSDGRGRHR